MPDALNATDLFGSPAKSRSFLAADGTKLAFYDQGDAGALPLLCLAGLTRVKEDFDPALPALQDTRLIRMDYRGRGDSGYSGAHSYTITQEGDDALALLDHLGVARAAILGTSRGGLIGMDLARRAHHRLLGLCLVDVGPELAPAGLTAIAKRIGRLPAQKSHDALAAALANTPGFANVPHQDWLDLAKRNWRLVDGEGGGEGGPALIPRFDPALAQAFQAAAAMAKAAHQPLAAPGFWEGWSATKGLPVALIRGENSDLITAETVSRMQEIRPDMGLAGIPDRAHVPFLNEPGAQAMLRDWLGKIAPESSYGRD